MASRFSQLLTVDIDKKLAIILFGLGLIVLILATTVFRSLLLQQISVTLLLASGVYLFLRARRKVSPTEEDSTGARDTSSPSSLQPRFRRLLDIAFWGLFITSLILISQHAYARPLSFLILVSFMSAILAVEIFTDKNTAYCLVKVLVIGILLRASAWYQFPSPVGSDPIIEVNFLRQLLAAGHTGEYMWYYQYYPVAYILSAFTSWTTGLGPKDSFFIIGVIEVLSLLFLFLIGREFFNKKVGLLAVLIMAVSDMHVSWGFWVKGMTLGIALLPILLFLLLVSRKRGGSLTFSFFTILVIFLVILTHTVASTVMVATLLIAWLASLIWKGLQGKERFEPPVALTMVLLSSVALLGYWLYASGFISYIGVVIENALFMDRGVMVEPAMLYRNGAVLTWQKLPQLVLIFFAILGCLSIFHIRKLDRKTLSQVWIALVGGGMIILNFLLYYVPGLGTLTPTRWFVFMNLLIAVPVAYGLLSILGRKGWGAMVGLFFLMLLLSGIMTTSQHASVDVVIPWDKRQRVAFTSSEMAAAESISQMADLASGQTPQNDTKVYTDFFYTLLFEHEFQAPRSRIVDASPIYKEDSKQYQGILVLRTAVTEVVWATFEGGHEELVMDQSQYQSFLNDPQSLLIYDNGAVQALRRSGD